MRMFYYAGAIPNFGDEINPWLWPQLMPEIFADQSEDELFVGIGSLLSVSVPVANKIIVLGTGSGYKRLPSPIPSWWYIYCVRGPLTARAMGLPPELGVGDGAILLRSLDLPEPSVRHRVSFMPHWETAIIGEWREICRATDIHYIDPRESVETVIREIRSSSRLITSAMHGAIVADAFRVPWIAAQPFSKKHFFKWWDWSSPLGVALDFNVLPKSSLDEYIYDNIPRLREFLQRRRPAPPEPPSGKQAVPAHEPFIPEKVRRIFNPACIARGTRALSALAKKPGQLSSDAEITRATERLLENVDRLRSDYGRGALTGAYVMGASK
jgi:hypothetical protein